MKILITGATGFIGGRLALDLKTRGHELICVVRKSSKVSFLRQEGMPFVIGDITKEEEVENIFSEFKIDVVFHIAGRVMEKDEELLHGINVIGTRNMCRASHKHHIDRFIYLSSVAVKSGNSQLPVTDDMPYAASNAYGNSKIEAERVVLEYRQKSLPVAIIRPCLVYGEGETHFFDTLMTLIRFRLVPIVDMPLMDSRLNLVYIGNLLQVLNLALEKNEALGGEFIAADDDVITFRNFFQILYDEYNHSRPPVIPDWIGAILTGLPFLKRKMERFFKERIYDTKRAKTLLGYKPEFSTEEALRLSVRDWKRRK